MEFLSLEDRNKLIHSSAEVLQPVLPDAQGVT